MDVTDALRELGGVARRAALLRIVDRATLEAAVNSGCVVRDARGLYALPDADVGVRAAARYGGALSLTSAALVHGWAVKSVPDKPHVTVTRGRKLPRTVSDAHLHFAELADHEVVDGVTSPVVTLRHCLRALPFDEALAVADSALREGFGQQALETISDSARGPGSRQVKAVVAAASPKAANPFESVLRAIGSTVPGLDLRPQVRLQDGDFAVRPDLVDKRLGVVVEADSFEWHGKRAALASDTRRYNMLVIAGYLVLRFCYEDVMFAPEHVRRILVRVVVLAELLNERVLSRTPAA